jgi:hypothetical protein
VAGVGRREEVSGRNSHGEIGLDRLPQHA